MISSCQLIFSNLEVSDRIRLSVYGDDSLKSAWRTFSDFAAHETLAVSAEWRQVAGMKSIDADEKQWLFVIEKA